MERCRSVAACRPFPRGMIAMTAGLASQQRALNVTAAWGVDSSGSAAAGDCRRAAGVWLSQRSKLACCIIDIVVGN